MLTKIHILAALAVLGAMVTVGAAGVRHLLETAGQIGWTLAWLILCLAAGATGRVGLSMLLSPRGRAG
ncbi:hypothetical protein ACFQXB_19100 [Plastorhodobacter daqingensis]|uniref:Uncharacterized protein n=1 Tax=Plastorhodobacter daqingensis TaxID=1387281 RepID=A0ABW2USV4_9RHOB